MIVQVFVDKISLLTKEKILIMILFVYKNQSAAGSKQIVVE